MRLNRLTIQPIIDLALREDIGTGDVTTLLTVPADDNAAAKMVAKQPGVIAGLPVAGWVFETLDSGTVFQPAVAEGTKVEAGTQIVSVRGPARALLMGERVALNFLQRMSGIATLTARFVEIATKGSHTKILDTRKTTPGLRVLEKYAVRTGGGTNHRFGLYDAVLIKDNHIATAGGITPAIQRARSGASPMMRIEVEVKDLDELNEALSAGADIIMLDNMSVDTIREAVNCVNGQAKLEVSGGVNESNLRELASTGVDYISIGALTHSAPALDISMSLKMADGP